MRSTYCPRRFWRVALEAVSKPPGRRGQSPFCSEDCAKGGQSPAVLKPHLVHLALVAAVICGGSETSASDAKALAEQVQIRRTQYGVPHIQGDTLEAAAFGFGYCQAEDHLHNILRGIIAARGELAATFGPGPDNKNVEADFDNRHYRVYARAVDELPQARSRLSLDARRLRRRPQLLCRAASRCGRKWHRRARLGAAGRAL